MERRSFLKMLTAAAGAPLAVNALPANWIVPANCWAGLPLRRRSERVARVVATRLDRYIHSGTTRLEERCCHLSSARRQGGRRWGTS